MGSEVENVSFGENDNNGDSESGDDSSEENMPHTESETDGHREKDRGDFFGVAGDGTEANETESTEDGDRGAETAINHEHDNFDKEWQDSESDEEIFAGFAGFKMSKGDDEAECDSYGGADENGFYVETARGGVENTDKHFCSFLWLVDRFFHI